MHVEFQNIKLRFIVTVYNRGHGSIHGVFGIHGITAALVLPTGGVPTQCSSKAERANFRWQARTSWQGALAPQSPGHAARQARARQGCCGVGHRPEQPDRPSAGLDGARRAAPRSQSTLVVWFLQKKGKKEGKEEEERRKNNNNGQS